MATIKTGLCPTCGNDRELAFFKFGVIQSTMCIFCLERYLQSFVIPKFKRNNDSSADNNLINSNGAVIGGFVDVSEALIKKNEN